MEGASHDDESIRAHRHTYLMLYVTSVTNLEWRKGVERTPLTLSTNGVAPLTSTVESRVSGEARYATKDWGFSYLLVQ